MKLIMGVRHALITPQSYTGMDTTSLYTSSGTLFVTIERRLTKLRTIVRRGTLESRPTQLRNITSDCYLKIVVS